MLQNEATVYAENDNFDAEDDIQLCADVLKKEIYFHRKKIKAFHSILNDIKSAIQFYISRKRYKEVKRWKILQKSIMILLDTSEMVIEQPAQIQNEDGGYEEVVVLDGGEVEVEVENYE